MQCNNAPKWAERNMESNRSEAGRDAAVTRSALWCGVLAGPFYLAVGLAQAFVREGFDLGRHPLSMLANGPGGWIQTANFVITGLMVIAAAAGLRRVLRPGARALPWFLGGFGAAMIVAAAFPADPVDGFPPGTPRGPRVRLPRGQLLPRRPRAHTAQSVVARAFLARQRPGHHPGVLRRHGASDRDPRDLGRGRGGVGLALGPVAPSGAPRMT
jgi:hypothetical protein